MASDWLKRSVAQANCNWLIVAGVSVLQNFASFYRSISHFEFLATDRSAGNTTVYWLSLSKHNWYQKREKYYVATIVNKL